MAKVYDPSKIKNITIAGGPGTGKTTLCEAVFFKQGLTTRMGSVDDGNTVLDFSAEEIERKSSISLAIANIEIKDHKLNIIDTPGYPDFIGEVNAAVTAADTTMIVLAADGGVDFMADDVWEMLDTLKKSKAIFVNRIDSASEGVDFLKDEMIEKFSNNLVFVNYPVYKEGSLFCLYDAINNKFYSNVNGKDTEIKFEGEEADKMRAIREKSIEAIASSNDTLLEKYLDSGALSEADMLQALNEEMASGKIVPVMFGSAVKSMGLDLMLDFVLKYFPAAQGKVEDKFEALVFKTVQEPGMGSMNYAKIISGSVKPGEDVFNVQKNSKERIGQLAVVFGKKRTDIPAVNAGDIVALIKLKDTATNNILVEDKNQTPKATLIVFPETFFDMAISGQTKDEEDKVGNALSGISKEDPTLRFRFDGETREMVVSCLGQVQLDTMIKKIKARYSVNVLTRPPRIPYKETIRNKAEVQGKYKRQSGGKGQYGDCWIKIEPAKGYEFIDKIFGGSIPKNFIPSVEKGIVEAMAEGVIAGYPVMDVRITLFDGSYHDVDSSDQAFKIAGSMALKKAVSTASPSILEPVYKVDIFVPDEYMGSVVGDLNARRGRVLGMDKLGKKNVIKSTVPLAELFKYPMDLRSITKGRGKFTMSFGHYEEAPGNVSQKLIETFEKSRAEGR